MSATGGLKAEFAIEKDSGESMGCRQLCFLCAFILPVSKLLETPSLLAYFSKGDLLLPALLHYILQSACLCLLLFACSKSEKPLLRLIDEKSKGFALATYALLCAYLVFGNLFMLLDMDRFVNTAFFDTAPAASAFLLFFFLSAFICTKGEKAIGRSADLCAPIFLIAFFSLIFMASGECDLSELFPLFGTSPKDNLKAFYHSFVHFSDLPLLFLPVCGRKWQKGEEQKVALSYVGGGAFVFVFLAVFYGVFGALAPRAAYAFDKIARYFSVLDVVGRIDLLLVYLVSIVLLYATALPLQLSSVAFRRAFALLQTDDEKRQKANVCYAIALNAAAAAFTFFCAKGHNAFYSLVTARLFVVFPVFSVGLSVLAIVIAAKKTVKKENVP